MSHWGDIPNRLHPVRCGNCGESWFVRCIGAGGNEERDFWPRVCCYCGIRFEYTTPETPEGVPLPPIDMSGKPLGATP